MQGPVGGACHNSPFCTRTWTLPRRLLSIVPWAVGQRTNPILAYTACSAEKKKNKEAEHAAEEEEEEPAMPAAKRGAKRGAAAAKAAAAPAKPTRCALLSVALCDISLAGELLYGESLPHRLWHSC